MNMAYGKAFDLSDRTVAITGGCGLLGREFAAAFRAHGARVALLDLAAAEPAKVAQDLAARHGGTILGLVCDVTDPKAAEAALDRVTAEMGGPNVLLNSAQSATADPKAYFARFEDYDLAEWRRVLSVDLDGMAVMAQAAVRRMASGGSLIQIGSIYGAYASDKRIYEGATYKGVAINNPAVYAVGKAGVVGLTRWLAATYADKGIRANAIMPGGVESGQSAEFIARYANRVPMGRMARKDEIAGTAIWLASDASSYVTGQSIFVDGGLSAW
jgi:NAD(P)-dependent dehydrogenase (short-subunit alcohol dehydrogenase family)